MISKATLTDAFEIASLHARVYGTQDQESALRLAWEETLMRKNNIVHIQRDRISGILGGVICSKPEKSPEAIGPERRITDFFVDLTKRRSGIGERLLMACVTTSDNQHAQIAVSVTAENKTAINLFSNQMFKKTKRSNTESPTMLEMIRPPHPNH